MIIIINENHFIFLSREIPFSHDTTQWAFDPLAQKKLVALRSVIVSVNHESQDKGIAR